MKFSCPNQADTQRGGLKILSARDTSVKGHGATRSPKAPTKASRKPSRKHKTRKP